MLFGVMSYDGGSSVGNSITNIFGGQAFISGFFRSSTAVMGGSQTITATATGTNAYAGVEILSEPATVIRGGVKDTYVPTPPSIKVVLPPASEKYYPRQTLSVDWLASGTGYASFAVYFSQDGGVSWAKVAGPVDFSTSSIAWVVPSIAVTNGLFRVDGIGIDGTVIASGESGVFSIAGVNPPAAVEPPPASVNPPAPTSGPYDSQTAMDESPDLNADYSLAPAANSLCPFSGALIKGSLPTVYYCGADGKRYVFVNQRVYASWYPDFSGVITIPDRQLSNIALGGNATYRPGVKLVKAQSDPKVYAIGRGAVLHWLSSEAVAAHLFGPDWIGMVDCTSDAYFGNYTIGDPIK
jgi:hypothetical protein